MRCCYNWALTWQLSPNFISMRVTDFIISVSKVARPYRSGMPGIQISCKQSNFVCGFKWLTNFTMFPVSLGNRTSSWFWSQLFLSRICSCSITRVSLYVVKVVCLCLRKSQAPWSLRKANAKCFTYNWFFQHELIGCVRLVHGVVHTASFWSGSFSCCSLFV